MASSQLYMWRTILIQLGLFHQPYGMKHSHVLLMPVLAQEME